MSDEDVFSGAREPGLDGEACKFAIGDRVRLKDGTGHKMTVMLTMRHESEHHLVEVNCAYVDEHGLQGNHRFVIDDLELIPPEED